MALSKTKLTKIVRAVNKSELKFYTLEDLSKDVGIKANVLRDDLYEFLPLIYFDYQYNLKDYLDEFRKKLEQLNKAPVKKKVYTKKDIDKYEGFIDYVYQNMTDNGGIFDTGYVLTKKDIRIIRKLLKEESIKLKEKAQKDKI